MARYSKGDHVRYVGKYAPEVKRGYDPGVIVAFRDNKTKVTVQLDGDQFTDDGLNLGTCYADWPIDQIEKVD